MKFNDHTPSASGIGALNARGDFIHTSGSVGIAATANTGTLNFTGMNGQIFSSPGFSNEVTLNINDTAGVSLSGNFNLSHILTFTSGKLRTNNDTLIIDSSGSVISEGSGKYVSGNMRISRTIGTEALNLYAAGINIGAGNDSLGKVTVLRRTDQMFFIRNRNSLNRSWSILSEFTPVSGREVSFSWITDDVSGRDLTSIALWKSSNGGLTWEKVAGPSNCSSTLSITGNIYSFGVFALTDSASASLIEDGNQVKALSYRISNYPNPFNPSTTLQFDILKAGKVKIEIFNIIGEKAALLYDGALEAGSYKIPYNAKDLAGGIYFCRMSAENSVLIRKIMLLK